MATQKSFIKIKGTVGDLTFYKTQDGHLLREKGGIDAKRMKTDPAFQRTRENGTEFGASCTAGKNLRKGLRTLLQHATDGRVVSRMVKVMMQIKNYDLLSVRGQRTPGAGIAAPEAQALLKDFNFNLRSAMDSVLFAPYTVDMLSGAIDFPALTPMADLNAPQGATHISLSSGMLDIDFDGGITDLELSQEEIFAIDATTTTAVQLLPAALPVGTGTKMNLLLLKFFQEVNGVQYVLRNGVYNALSVVGISG